MREPPFLRDGDSGDGGGGAPVRSGHIGRGAFVTPLTNADERM
jgi:hypothetical protein